MKKGHLPIRTCLGCRSRRPKWELMRVVVKEGRLMIDREMRLPGRGAYLCPDLNCWVMMSRKKGGLAKALRYPISRVEEVDFLTQFAHGSGKEG